MELPKAERARLEAERKPVPMVSAEQVERERQALRDGTAALLNGANYMEVAREWNAAGLRTARGRTWVSAAVRDVLVRPINAGLIEHDGAVVGRMQNEPIVDPDEFDRVRALVLGRRRGRPYSSRYVGTGFLRCGLCKSLLSAHPKGKKANGEPNFVYLCNTQRRGCGKVAATVAHVDNELRKLVIARLSDPKHAAGVSAYRARVNENLGKIRAEIERCEEVQQALAARLARREISLAVFDESNAVLVKDLATLTAERDALSSGDTSGPETELDAEEAATEWEDADYAGRRVMLKRALGRNQMFIDKAKPGRHFDPKRVRLGPPPGHDG